MSKPENAIQLNTATKIPCVSVCSELASSSLNSCVRESVRIGSRGVKADKHGHLAPLTFQQRKIVFAKSLKTKERRTTTTKETMIYMVGMTT
jgi:hypothetical protein